MHNETARRLPALNTLFALFLPPLLAVATAIVLAVVSGEEAIIDPTGRMGPSVIFGAIAICSGLIGVRRYGVHGLGVRGGRPLYASIGFATLGWLAFFLARLLLISSNQDVVVAPDLGSTFLYLFFFEAFALHLWLFGLLFRSVAAWRGPLAAAISSGLLFGAVGFLLFEESFIEGTSAFLFFLGWGLFYGLIRLRTGSFLGLTIVQALQSLTTWHILLPEPVGNQLPNFYLSVGIALMLVIWRLWPADEEDYRV